MDRESATDEQHEFSLPGVWHWIVMVPVAAFAVLLCAAVLWVMVGQPVASAITGQRAVSATATAVPLAVTDTTERTARLTRLMATKGATWSWSPHVRAYRVEGETITLDTDYPDGTNADSLTQMAALILHGMRCYGDPVTTAAIRGATGQVLLTLYSPKDTVQNDKVAC